MREPARSLAVVGATFALLFVLLYVVLDGALRAQRHPNAALEASADAPMRVELERNAAGQYLVPGRINGREVTFLLDTGATHVAIPASVAEGLGLERGPEVAVETAAGRARAATTVIDRIRIGGIAVRGVRGTINPALGGDEVLLGMSFLRHVDLSQRHGRVILEAADGGRWGRD